MSKKKEEALYAEQEKDFDWNLEALNEQASIFRDKNTGAIFSLEDSVHGRFLKQHNKGKLQVN
jgi:hypothetical protein